MQRTAGQHVSGATADGVLLSAAGVDETQVRAAAGVTLVLGAMAFAYAALAQQYAPIRVVTTFFFLEFLIRLTAGLGHSPVGLISRAMTRGLPPQWVSAKPKRFAWTLGLAMSFSMMVITNSGIRGALPATICAICLVLMWMESVLGICLGCRVHAGLVRRGWTTRDPEHEVCAHGECALPAARERRDVEVAA